MPGRKLRESGAGGGAGGMNELHNLNEWLSYDRDKIDALPPDAISIIGAHALARPCFINSSQSNFPFMNMKRTHVHQGAQAPKKQNYLIITETAKFFLHAGKHHMAKVRWWEPCRCVRVGHRAHQSMELLLAGRDDKSGLLGFTNFLSNEGGWQNVKKKKIKKNFFLLQ